MVDVRAAKLNRPVIWFVLFATCQLIFTIWLYPGGYLTWDSGTYHLMVKTLAETGGFFIENGLDLFASPLMRIGQTIISDGKLVSQYPEFYTFLALPFYALFGFSGYATLNSCALIGTCFLIWRITPWFVAREKARGVAVLIYLLATFAWEYSVSSYPHLTSTFLILAACCLAWSVFLRRADMPGYLQNEALRLFLSGLVFGLAIGVRLDSLFAGMALFFPLLHGRGIDWRRGAWISLGLALPLAALAWINMIKFGTPNPLSYGQPASAGFVGNLAVYLPAALVVLLFAGLTAYRDKLFAGFGRRRVLLGCAAVFTIACFIPLGAVLSQPGFQDANFAKNLFQILVDLRLRPDISEPGLSRSENGAMIYMGGVKKSLVQSMPFLVLALATLARGLWRGRYGQKTSLWLVPAGFVGVYGMLAWHGSVAQNMRYLNPILPFLAILMAREYLTLGLGRLPRARLLPYSVLLWAGLCLLFALFRNSIAAQEMLFLNMPLLLAAALLMLWWLRGFGLFNLRSNRVIAFLLLFSFIWSSAMVLAADFYRSTGLRLGFTAAAEHLLPQIENNALVLTNSPDVIWPIIERGDKVLIATYIHGNCEQIKSLIATFIATRPVYWIGGLNGSKKSKSGEGQSNYCVPKKLLDGRALHYGRPKRWDTVTDDFIHRVRLAE